MYYTLYTYPMITKPKERPDIKAEMQAMKNQLNSPGIDWDSYVVWTGSQNHLPAYLWQEWKAELTPRGFTWQKFTKLLRYKTDRMVYWYRGMISWDELIKEITEFIEGRYGKDLAKR